MRESRICKRNVSSWVLLDGECRKGGKCGDAQEFLFLRKKDRDMTANPANADLLMM